MRDDQERTAPPRSARNRPRTHQRPHRPSRRAPRPGSALPERRPRLGYLFAVLPVALVISLLASGPVLYRFNKIFVTPAVPTISASGASGGAPVPTPLPLPDWDKKERVNILLIGVDQRDGESFGRTDTMILVSVDPANKTVGLMSLPRDLRVNIPNHGLDKLNAAFVYGQLDYGGVQGGILLLQRTLQQDFGIAVPYWAQVDFHGFVKIVDTFGGVTVDPPYPLKDDEYPTETNGYTSIYFPAGFQHLTGDQALIYARTRHPDSDFGRARRQQEVILALRQQALNLHLVTKFWSLLGILSDSVQTDLSQQQIAALASLGQSIPRDSIKRYDLSDPNLIEGCAFPDDQGNQIDYVCVKDWPGIRRRIKEIVPNAIDAPPVTPTPDPVAKIDVRNGTYRDQFATHTVAVLQREGFTGAFVDATEVDNRPQPATIIYNYSNKLDTALLAAQALGLTEDAVRQGTGTAPNGADIMIVLGDDLPYTPPSVTPTTQR
jgi:polyisoprenyl-teichoic acid--peptidoglycan teichoic acid transferase